jgi:hypothetical protein
MTGADIGELEDGMSHVLRDPMELLLDVKPLSGHLAENDGLAVKSSPYATYAPLGANMRLPQAAPCA